VGLSGTLKTGEQSLCKASALLGRKTQRLGFKITSGIGHE
jgi:hypothetical protein